MARDARRRSMPTMSTAIVIEAPLELESVTADPFVADLDARPAEPDARLSALLRRLAAAPHRRIYD